MASPLVAVVGPTGSGKSDLAIHLSQMLDGEVVGCDSIQIYRQFDIGSAKTPRAERRVPHHLVDCVNPDSPMTAGEYAAEARTVVAGITGRGKLPVVSGGTGFYLRALLDGLFEGPTRRPSLRRRLEAREARWPGILHRLLERRDPPSAARIHPNDRPKLIRALEVCIVSGEPMSTLHRRGTRPLEGYRIFLAGLNPPREALYERINARVERMFRAGLIEETRAILESGVSPQAPAFGSVGYAQAVDVIHGRLTVAEAIEATQTATRQYAKRQWTWFRADQRVRWFDGFGDDPAVQSEVLREAMIFRSL